MSTNGPIRPQAYEPIEEYKPQRRIIRKKLLEEVDAYIQKLRGFSTIKFAENLNNRTSMNMNAEMYFLLCE